MPYYLHHYFDPDFDYQNLKPKLQKDGRVDHYNLDYVQNVIAGQILAEWKEVDLTEVDNLDSRFVSEKKHWPLGPNVAINPQNKNQIIATANGYVFYFEGKIAVKTVLNVRRDVDFHTGNVYFVGDLIVHGTVRSGFEVKGHNVRIKGNVEAAKVYAGGSILIEGGVKGGGEAEIIAQENLKTSFCEKSFLFSGKKLIIDGSSIHSKLFADEYIIVKDRMQGGLGVSTKLFFAQNQLGGGMGVKTEIILGYKASFIKKYMELETKIKDLIKEIENLKLKINKNDIYKEEYQDKLQSLEIKLAKMKKIMDKNSEKINHNFNAQAKLVVPGRIRSGVEVSIGPFYYKVDEDMENKRFELEKEEIKLKSPAIVK